MADNAKPPAAVGTAAVAVAVDAMVRAMHREAHPVPADSRVTMTAPVAMRTSPHAPTTPMRRDHDWGKTGCPASPASLACPVRPVANLTLCAPAST